MTTTLQEIIRRRIEAANIAQARPTAEQLADVSPQQLREKAPQLAPHVISAMDAAARALHTSDVGKEINSRILDMTPQQVLARAADIANLPEIQNLATLARRDDVFAADELGDGTIIKELMAKYAPRSLLSQFAAMVDFGAGATIYIGVALDLTDFNSAVIYVGGGIGIGLSGIAAVGEGVGLTSNPNSGMTGFCAGVDAGGTVAVGALLDVSLGLSFPYWPGIQNLQPSKWTAVVYLLGGVGASVDVYAGFTLQIINENLPDVVQPAAANCTTVYSITCDMTQDSGKDEIYFKVSVDTSPGKTFRYPLWDYFSIGQGKTWVVGFTINFESTFTITLYNADVAGDQTIHGWNVSAADIPTSGNTKNLVYDTGSGGLFHNNIHYEIALFTP